MRLRGGWNGSPSLTKLEMLKRSLAVMECESGL